MIHPTPYHIHREQVDAAVPGYHHAQTFRDGYRSPTIAYNALLDMLDMLIDTLHGENAIVRTNRPERTATVTYKTNQVIDNYTIQELAE